MRLTITRKIALAVIGVVILSIGTMAWVTSQNLQRGFINYLNEAQGEHLDKLRDVLAEFYRDQGSFESLRDNPRAMRRLLDQINPRRTQSSNDPENPDARPPPRERPAFRPPPPERDGAWPPPPPEMRMPPPPVRAPAPPDPLGFGQRLSLQDASGQALIGPPETPAGMKRTIVVDGRTVGTLSLEPLRQIQSASDAGFIRTQLRELVWLALGLIALSILLALWLARQLLRPIAGLRSATQQIAQGKFSARAPVLNRDELSELAQHVNAMATALEAGEQQRRRMLADVSHELRTPLTVIRGEIEALLDGIRQADPRALDSLHAEVLRLNKLVDDLHQLALADAGDLRYRPQTLDLGPLLRQAVARHQARAADAGLSLSAELPPEPLWVHADPDRLAQVIGNLLENSVRYTDAGGTIACALAMHGKQAQLIVDDSAPGVATGTHERLFQRLYRADQARSRASPGKGQPGSGLGLSICKAMVEAHGGSIHALPSSLGGVRIVLQLPLVSRPQST